jgi:ATP-dependent helicase/nuclease subunit A
MRLTKNFAKFTDNQRHALDGLRNLAVRANAGSGKTSVLVERMVQILAASWDAGRPLKLTQLVAITFTRKAAAELQERLHQSFDELALAAATPEEKAYWAEQAAELPHAMIGTIDSFCVRILREFGLYDRSPARLEPDFDLLDDYEARVLQREAIDRVINRLGSAAPGAATDPGDRARIEACNWWATKQGYAPLVRHLSKLLNHFVAPATIIAAHANAGTAVERVNALWSSLPAVRKLDQNRVLLRQVLRNMLADMEQEPKRGVLLNKLGDRLSEILDALARSDPVGDELALGILKDALLTREGEPRSCRGLAVVEDDFVRLQEAWGSLLRDFDFDRDGELAAIEGADRLVRLLGPVHDEYLELCRRVNRYSFLTVARQTRDLLAGFPEVSAALKQRYRYVMVDEFQDTNQLQWEIISWVVGAGPEGPLDRDRLFIVGDPQQSIYRFRDADVSVYNRIQEMIRACNDRHGFGSVPTQYDTYGATVPSNETQRLGSMSLKENFRSLHPVPLLLMNQVYERMFDPAIQGLDPENDKFETVYQSLAPGVKSAEQGEVRYVIPAADRRQPILDNDRSEDKGEGDAEASLAGESEQAATEQTEAAQEDDLGKTQVQAVVDQLVSLYGQPKFLTEKDQPKSLAWKDMAILLPSRTVVLRCLEKELTERGVPFVVTRGIGFWQRQEVRDVVSLASFLADAGDELALFAVLRGPLGQLSDTEILFLSEFGRGSLARGLWYVRDAGDTLPSPSSVNSTRGATGSTGRGRPRAIAESDRLLSREAMQPVSTPFSDAWQKLEQGVQAALAECWQAFSAEQRQRVRLAAARLRDWEIRVDRLGHADLLRQALEESGAYALYGAESEGQRILANLEQLFAVIHAEEARSGAGLARLARWLRQQVNESSREEQATPDTGQDAIQIMTVHAAKGLEFPVVAVMKMEREADWVPYHPLLVKNEWDALLRQDAAGMPPVTAGTVAVSIRHPLCPREMHVPHLLLALRRLDRAQQRAEARRLFYVAGTRAKERLILAGQEPGRGRRPEVTWQKWFEEALQAKDEGGGMKDKQTIPSDSSLILHPSSFPVTIVTKATRCLPPPKPLAPRNIEDLQLQLIDEQPLSAAVATTGLENMREMWRENPRDWWLTYRVHVLPRVNLPEERRDEGRGMKDEGAVAADSSFIPHPSSFGGLGTAIGTLVHRMFENHEALSSGLDRVPPDNKRRELLEAMAANLLSRSSGARESAQDTPDDDSGELSVEDRAVRAVVAAVEAVLKRLHDSGNKQAEDVRRLFRARGTPEVNFALELGRWRITGRFDKLLEVPAATHGTTAYGGCGGRGFEIVDWKTDADGTPDEVVERHRPQMRLYALALYRSGRHVLVNGAIQVHLAMLHHLEVRTLSFTPEELEALAADLQRELEATNLVSGQ